MTVPELLLAFLGSAIALAGFAGIVSQIDRGSAKQSPELASFRVRYLVFAAGSVLVFSVSPMLAVLLSGGRNVWPVACAIEAAFMTYMMARAMQERRSLRDEKARGMHPMTSGVIMGLGFVVVALLVAGAAGYAPSSASFAVRVFWFLLAAASIFAQLVLALDSSLHNTGGTGE